MFAHIFVLSKVTLRCILQLPLLQQIIIICCNNNCLSTILFVHYNVFESKSKQVVPKAEKSIYCSVLASIRCQPCWFIKVGDKSLFLWLNFRCIHTKQYVWEMKADFVITQCICSCLLFDSKETVSYYLIEPLWHIVWALSVCMHPHVSFGPVDISLAQEVKSLPPAPESFLF